MPDCHSVSSRPGRTRVAAGGLVLLAVLWPVLGGDPARAAAGSDRLLPGGSDWLTNPQTQIRWGEDYIQSRYGRPCQAWTFWQARTYYAPRLAVVPF
jgi:hypothetical protein